MNDERNESPKATVTLPGTVEKIVRSTHPDLPDKAQIAVEGADHLYREIRIDNTLRNANGEAVALKPGAEVDVKVEAPAEAVEQMETAKPNGQSDHGVD